MPQAIEATDAAERSAIYVLRSEGNLKVGSQKTPRRREMDSNFRFRAR
jgi:hypothetical protein